MTKEIDGITYYRKADGSLVPEDQIKDLDKLRDQMVMGIADKVLSLKQEMIRTKADVVEDIEAFMETASEQYGVNYGGEKGNLTFTSFDGNIQIKYYSNDYLTFNEGIYVAKQLIDDFLADITKDSSKSIKQIVNNAFNLKQGRMDVKAILKLRDINETDPRWVKAMGIIDESRQYVTGNKALRLYIRNRSTDKMEYIPLDFSVLMGGRAPAEAEEPIAEEPEGGASAD